MLGRLGQQVAVRTARQGLASVAGAARFHAGRVMSAEAAEAVAQTDGRTDPADFGIDRANPQVAPHTHWESYLNDYESNVAELPADGWKGWEDLPAPYKYYQMKVDPKDVEEHGFAWNVFNNWFTGIPAVVGISTPLFIWNVIPIDSAFEYACIFWFAIAVIYKNAGEAIYGALTSELVEQRKLHESAEEAYENALTSLHKTFTRSVSLPEQMQKMNAAERALRNVEAEAATRNMLIGEVDRLENSLDFLLSLREAGSAGGSGNSAGDRAFDLAADKLSSDKKVASAVINDAIASLASGDEQAKTLEELLTACRAAAAEEAAAASSDDSAAKASAARDAAMFTKRFGYAQDSVTPEMLAEAEKDESKMTVLFARCGGKVPKVGDKLFTGNPLNYAKADA